MKKLSKRQQQVLDFIVSEVHTKGYPPSVREIGEAIGLTSSSTVHGHLSRLESKGLIRRDPTKPRAIEILIDRKPQELNMHPLSAQGIGIVQVPIIGKVTAGEPITAIEHVEEYFPLPENMVPNTATVFILEISGDSMVEAGIHNGDKVIVKQQQSASNGDIVIAMTEENEATCKRFFKEDDHFRLQPENSTMMPILVPSVTILGKVIGLYRDVIH